jgi:hypothetical protein
MINRIDHRSGFQEDVRRNNVNLETSAGARAAISESQGLLGLQKLGCKSFKSSEEDSVIDVVRISVSYVGRFWLSIY